MEFILHRLKDVTAVMKAGGDEIDESDGEIALRAMVLRRHIRLLQERESHFQTIFNSAPTGIVLTTLEGKYIQANERYSEILGYSEEELRGMDFYAITHPADREDNRELFQALIDGEVDRYCFEKRYIRKNGEVRWGRITVSITRSHDGTTLHLIGIVEDMSGEKELQAPIDQTQRRNRLAGRVAKLGGWIVDLEGETDLIWSDELCLIHEVAPGNTPGLEEALDYYPEPYRSEMQGYVERCIEKGEPFDLESRLDTATGRRIWVRAMGEAVRDEQGNIIRIQGAFQDINEEKAALRRMKDLSSRLATTMESISDGFFTLDDQWRFAFINTRAQRMIGREGEQLVGQSIWEEFPEAREGVFYREYSPALEENITVNFEAYFAPLDL